MAEADVDSDGSWGDFPAENPERAAIQNREIARRTQLLQNRIETNDWCTCGNCWPVMYAESSYDVTCCQESETSKAVCGQNKLFGDNKEYRCITGHPSFFHFCLYPMHLEHIAHLYKMDDVDMRVLDRNSKLRYVAYRSYTGWLHGYLGRGHRRVIPQCVSKAIRQAFPSAAGEYRGFLPERPRVQQEPQQ